MAKNATINKAKYDRENMRTYLLKYNKKYDSDIIEKLDSVESKQGYIRQLIQADITRTCSVPDTKQE